ncbi:MAG: tRNA (N(6)-L-threonylcarbamoyladenosine(37)-C(2))-methylthiotransferase MtaB [Bacteroidia bacterium]|nr:tRNA (N(6)-L-threonylcarbamoyladenosine(37)-C(2))-methylthiotransferase MtaB [Bacteroidia bacterium]
MATPRSVAFHTLGCKLNYSESSALARQFEGAGYSVVPYNELANVYVINTCSVTDFADKKCRQAVRRARRKSPDAKVIVTGCYAQLKPKEISDIEGVDLVLGAAEKFRILEFVNDLTVGESEASYFAGAIKEVEGFNDAYSFGDRTRSFLKVQDGCDYKCSFCTIPLARGKSRSNTVASVVETAQEIASKGIKEVVLTGVNIGDFGLLDDTTGGSSMNQPRETFLDLIQALDEVDGIERFRISSIEPNLCSDAIIEVVAQSKRFVPHFHIPLQSGNDKMLKMMRRRYKRTLYADRVALIKRLMPHACIGVDVIVGFPGETDGDFKESYRFINELDVSYLHVFTYSERANTHAINLEDPVPMHVRRQRNEMLRILSEKKKRYFYNQHLGSERKVLFEQHKDPQFLSGFTDNYIKVLVPFEDGLLNTIHSVKLDQINSEGMMISSMKEMV